MKQNCKNCGANEFKDGKCSYCGTEYGLTGDVILDSKLLALKRKRIMEEDGWKFSRGYSKWENELYKTSGESATHDWKAVKNEGQPNEQVVYVYGHRFEGAMNDFWMMYCQEKYEPELEKYYV